MEAPAPAPTERWSVALSGGGHRAAVYAVGALLYLVRSGINERVDTVVSVSGGSLTNGVIAQAPVDFSAMEEKDFLEAIRPLLYRCAYKGTVQWAASVLAWAFVTGVVAVGTLLLLLGSVAHWFRTMVHVETDRPGLYFCAALIAALFVLAPLLSIRCWLADRVFRKLLFTQGGVPVKLQASSASAPTSSEVLHVFCASELQSNLHAYFSPRFLYNMNFSLSTRFPELHLSTAVQASSNFPPAFPARRMSARRLGFQVNAEKHLPPAPGLWLTDGGVYDNMAEEWITRSFSRNPEDPRPIPDDLLPVHDPDRLLVVNASKRDDFKKATGFRTPFLGNALRLLRISSLMHQVTTTNRRSRLNDEFAVRKKLRDIKVDPDSANDLPDLERAIGLPGALVHIGTPADWIVRKYPGSKSGPYHDVNAAFATYPDDRWARGTFDATTKEWVGGTFNTVIDLGTKLSRTGEDTAAALIWQGYVQTMAKIHVYGDGPMLEVPSRQSIIDILVSSKPAN
ncbi:MAG: patatin-like phospholipase family protein [Marmoricola sp.]